MSDVNTLQNMLVYVPQEYISSFKTEHIGTGKENDNYYNKLAFWDNGIIATHAMTFGIDHDSVSKIGLDNLPSEQQTVVSYLVGLGHQVDTLATTVDEQMRAYVGTRIAELVNNAPEALDTLGEIAAYLAADENLSSFAEMQAQIGQRAMVNTAEGEIPYAGTLYQYASYIANFEVSKLDVADQAVANQYVTAVSEVDGKISVSRTALPTYTDAATDGEYVSKVDQVGGQVVVTRAALPTYTDTAVAGKYVSAVSETNGTISVTRADLPTVGVDSTAGAANQYISALSANGNVITATYTTLPSIAWAEQTGKYIAAITQSEGSISAVTFKDLPTLTVASSSTNYLSVSGHEITQLVTAIKNEHDFVHTPDPQQGESTYSVGTLGTIGTGVATASAVVNRIHSDEVFIASALSTLDKKIDDVVASTANGLDASITIYDDGAYVSATIVEEDGKLTSTGSSLSFSYEKIYAQLNSSTTANDANSYGNMTVAMTNGKFSSSSLVINKANILAETSATITSGSTAEPIQVSVTEENHKITAVNVIFNDLSTLWEVYGGGGDEQP